MGHLRAFYYCMKVDGDKNVVDASKYSVMYECSKTAYG